MVDSVFMRRVLRDGVAFGNHKSDAEIGKGLTGFVGGFDVLAARRFAGFNAAGAALIPGGKSCKLAEARNPLVCGALFAGGQKMLL